MAASKKKSPQADPATTPVFAQTLHRLRVNPNAKASAGGPPPKAKKRDNTFSKSRDTREDRGTRQAKTSRSPQSSGRGR